MLGLVRGTTVDELAAIGMTPIGDPVDAETGLSASAEAYVVQQHGPDVVVLDGRSLFVDAAPIIGALAGREVLGVILSSVSDTYGLDVVTPDGRRQIVSQEGAIVLDQGVALPEEPAAWDEDAALALFERLSGRSFDAILAAPGVPVRGPSAARAVAPPPLPGAERAAPDEPAAAPKDAARPRRRGLFRRR